MNNVAIAHAFVQPSPFWHRLKEAVVHFAGGLVAQPSFAADSRNLDDRVLHDLDIAPDMHGPVAHKAAPEMTTPRPGRPVCRWRMDSSGSGLTMDWIDPCTQREPPRAAVG